MNFRFLRKKKRCSRIDVVECYVNARSKKRRERRRGGERGERRGERAKRGTEERGMGSGIITPCVVLSSHYSPLFFFFLLSLFL